MDPCLIVYRESISYFSQSNALIYVNCEIYFVLRCLVHWIKRANYVKRLQCYLIWVSVYFQRSKILWIGSVIVWLKWLFFVLVASPTAWRIILAFHRRLWREFLNEESGNTPLLYRIQGCYDQTGDPTLFHWEHRKSSPEYCFRSLLWLLQEWQWSENQFIVTYTPFIHLKNIYEGMGLKLVS